jgi:3-dehydroquinate dehydratase II
MKKNLRLMTLHGPNLDRLGKRQPEIYGTATLEDVNRALDALAEELGIAHEAFQTNHEGAYIEAIHGAADGGADGLVLNPGAWTHTSIAIRDALLATGLPAVEVHLSNVHARESFRHGSMVADVVVGRVMGFGVASYLLGMRGLVGRLRG